MKSFINFTAIVLTLFVTFCAFKGQQKEFQQWESVVSDTVPSQSYKMVWTGFSIHHYDNYTQINGDMVQSDGYVVTVSDTSITSPLMGYMPIKWTSDTTLVCSQNNENYNCTFTIHDNWNWIECKLIQHGEVIYHAKIF
jgi:hypothetical protein